MRPQPATLAYTDPEIHAFLAGVHVHEFDLVRYAESTTAARSEKVNHSVL